MTRLLRRVRKSPTKPLSPLRPTSEILADIDHQVGRLSKVREQALELIERMELLQHDDAR